MSMAVHMPKKDLEGPNFSPLTDIKILQNQELKAKAEL